MAVIGLAEWVDEFSGAGWLWYIKRLSANDTLASGSHQAGPYVPKAILFRIFPSLQQSLEENPRVSIPLYLDSHPDIRTVTAIWYNNKLRGGTRNEARLTNFGGRRSALLDPESTGALAVFSFGLAADAQAEACHVWVCRDAIEEEFIEASIGVIEPGEWRLWSQDAALQLGLFAEPERRGTCQLAPDELPSGWLEHFPSGLEIVQKALELCPDNGRSVDERLMQRRDCEYALFLSLEEALVMPRLAEGFGTVQAFIDYAQSVLQRRKARAGRSLELHLRQIFVEEGLVEGRHFAYQPETESGKRPDFIFPSETAYKDPYFSAQGLAMLAVKTTCKDRWRQVLNEAARIPHKHLFTLQEGVSENQFDEMTQAGIQLVVPASLHPKYPQAVQTHLLTLESFLAEMRLLTFSA